MSLYKCDGCEVVFDTDEGDYLLLDWIKSKPDHWLRQADAQEGV